jgi:hypothetical protein
VPSSSSCSCAPCPATVGAAAYKPQLHSPGGAFQETALPRPSPNAGVTDGPWRIAPGAVGDCPSP